MVDGLDLDDATTAVGSASKSTTSERTYRNRIEQIPDGCAELVFALIDQSDAHDVEICAFAEDAREQGRVIPDDVRESLDLPEDVETFSFEDIFQLDFSELDYIGNPPRDRNEDGSATIPDEWKELSTNGKVIEDARALLNGLYADTIQERFAPSEDATGDNPQVFLAARVGKKSRHEDKKAQRRHVCFYIQDSDLSPERALKARQKMGDISESEYEDLLAESTFYEE